MGAKITVTNQEPVQVTPDFNAGDYFITEGGFIRQIVACGDYKYQIIDPSFGTQIIRTTADNPNEIARIYAAANGTITRLELKELIVARTMEVLTKQEAQENG